MKLEVEISSIEFHPLSDIFPSMTEGEYRALKGDIERKGLLEPICIFEGKILDGRHRYRACLELGHEAISEVRREYWENISNTQLEEYEGTDPVGYIISKNIQRRHLSESQRAMVAARLANMRQGERTDLTAIAVKSVSQQDAAKLLNTSVDSVQRAKFVQEQGSEELIQTVDSGQIVISVAAEIAKEVPLEEQREIVTESVKTGKPQNVLRQFRQKQRMTGFQEQEIPAGKFQIILADPPWQYEHHITDSRKIENQYPTMELDKICRLPIAEICADSVVLFLWVTSPKLEEGLRVINAWGFRYRTCAVWIKDSIGMGYYFRQRHELLLVATRGDAILPLPENRPDSVISAPRSEHSQKPDAVYRLIETMYPGLKKIELFARRAYNGDWAAWGNELLE